MVIRFSEKDLVGSNFIPEGETEVMVAQIDSGNSKGGEPMLTVVLKDRMGREAKEYFLLSDKTLWKLANFAMAGGIAKDQLAANGLEVGKLLGLRLMMVKKQVGVRDYNGKSVKDYSQEFFKLQQGAATPSAAKEDDILF